MTPALLWVGLAFVAAVAQLGRNLGQRNLVRGPGALSRDTANAARYWVGFPLALLVFLALGPILELAPFWAPQPVLCLSRGIVSNHCHRFADSLIPAAGLWHWGGLSENRKSADGAGGAPRHCRGPGPICGP